jgi:hypothetical protein
MEKREIVKLSDADKFKSNPFKDTLNVILTLKNKSEGTDSIIINPSTGEYQGVNVLSRPHTCDNEKFVKLFVNKISEWFEFSSKAQKIFMYVMQQMKPNIDEVYLVPDDMIDKLDIKSRTTIYDAIAELVSVQALARSFEPNCYYINPSYFFNGDRVAFIETYERQKAIDRKPEEHIKLEPNENF